ncbi:hypothetical protein E1091_03455 [Micromonospora fluostatini]|uniref:Uncharacterized protein n=2 Tax=Micromonospora TaxID=1873 RepID=A0ABY2DL87_9ACTN|nr:hypothetical protein E1091_03455 [Micromonospora fluostatini]
MPTLADLIAEECQRSAGAETDGAEGLAESGDFEGAWKTHKRSDALATMAHNFDNRRADAPIYVGRSDLWHDTIRRMAQEAHLRDVSDNSRLYVWECTDVECEHLADLESAA